MEKVISTASKEDPGSCPLREEPVTFDPISARPGKVLSEADFCAFFLAAEKSPSQTFSNETCPELYTKAIT